MFWGVSGECRGVGEKPDALGKGVRAEPGCGWAESDPVCGVGDFAAAARYLRTVTRSRPSSRAILRLDQHLLVQGDDGLLLSHFELIHRPEHPPTGEPQGNASPQRRVIFTRKRVGDFARKLTLGKVLGAGN